MDFGLWVEPEMATLNSTVLRAHPEWILSETPTTRPLESRNQFTIDLRIPAAFDHVLTQLDALLTEYPIAYLKWDHNRDLLIRRVHEQTLAVYRLMREIALRHPETEIEACASGGGRIDLRMLESVVRVWPSDNNDPLERQAIYRWTTLLIPPELFGAHVGAATSHLTGRTHTLPYRLATALFGWAGIEWDLREATGDELRTLSDWAQKYKSLRGLIHSGVMVRADRDDALWVTGVVAEDGSEAVFSISAVGLTLDAVASPVRLPGLDPDRSYVIEPLTFGAPPRYLAAALPRWLSDGTVSLLGRLLSEIGVAAPPLAPEQTLVLRLIAQD
jgi:alpha-galactosidase